MSRHVNVAVRETRVRARMIADALNGDQQIKMKSVLESIVYPSLSSGRKRAWNSDRARYKAQLKHKNVGESVTSRVATIV